MAYVLPEIRYDAGKARGVASALRYDRAVVTAIVLGVRHGAVWWWREVGCGMGMGM